MSNLDRLPNIIPISQSLSDQHIINPTDIVQAGLDRISLKDDVYPGMRIAIGLGSRGIGCILDVVLPVVKRLQAIGAKPFIVPAMGSHGGDNAEGQRAVLAGYGITEETLDIPIISSMDVVELGMTPGGVRVYMDAHAAGADGIIIINRIKEHTAFKGRWESGLMKMLAVGLGKRKGAAEIHRRGIVSAMPEAARFILENKPVLFGVGIVENGYHQPAEIRVVPAEKIPEEEFELLQLARHLLPRLPFDPVDFLVLKEMGKDISGTGIDLNVVGMWRRNGGPVTPVIRMITVLDLTPDSHGNAIGVGYADLIPQRLSNKIDVRATNANCITSQNWAGARIPITLPTDREVFDTALGSLADPSGIRMILAANTQSLGELWISETLLGEIKLSQSMQQLGPPQPLLFDKAGNMLFPNKKSEGWFPISSTSP